MSHRDAARARWRADLHEFTAAGATKGGLASLARSSGEAADELRAYADLMDELDNAKAGYAEDQNVGTKAILDDVKQRVVAFRTTKRTGEVQIGLVNNFEEPSDAELVGLGY